LAAKWLMLLSYLDMVYKKINKINKFSQHGTCTVCILFTLIAMAK